MMIAISGWAGSGQTEMPNQWAMDNAIIGPDSPIEVPSGGTYFAKVVYPVPDGPLFPLKADVTWWIEPAVKGIFVEAKSGAITVANSVPHGTRALLHADVAGRKEKLHARLYVYSARIDPLVGSWKVESSQACGPRQNGPPGGYAAIENDMDWKFHVNQEFWIGREFGIRAGVRQSGIYEYNSGSSELKLTPKWPAKYPESHWKVALQANDNMQLTSSLPGHTPGCSYVLRRAATGN